MIGSFVFGVIASMAFTVIITNQAWEKSAKEAGVAKHVQYGNDGPVEFVWIKPAVEKDGE